MRELVDIVRHRPSERVAFDPGRAPPAAHVDAILEAARWAPTAHNMQNYEIVVVDDLAVLAQIGGVHAAATTDFVRENHVQFSFSEDELIRKGTGLLASMFPPAWRSAEAGLGTLGDVARSFLDSTLRSCPMVLVVVYDRRKRAPASDVTQPRLMTPRTSPRSVAAIDAQSASVLCAE